MFSAATKTGSQPAAAANYIEDVFSTYLTTGASANITVVNGIDLSGKGGMVWQKTRNAAGYNTLFDTVRGANYYLSSNTTGAQAFSSNILPTFNNDGFVIGTDNNLTTSGTTGVNWTFREQPKFFDVVTYTGNSSTQNISHNLGSVPGIIIVKSTSTASQWNVYHRSLGATQAIKLQSTAAATSSVNFWNDTNPTSTQFTLGPAFNTSGETYVAYLFAHDAGGFGTTGTDNVISCGSFTTDSGGSATVSLGYEPQYILWKQSNAAGDWYIYDVMRGFSYTTAQGLKPNLSVAEVADGDPTGGVYFVPTATGFSIKQFLNASATFIYMAIRRPMKVPTDATTVFKPVTLTPSGATTVTTGFPVDLIISGVRNRGGSITGTYVNDRLRGDSTNQFTWLLTNTTGAEGSASGFGFGLDNNTAVIDYVYNYAAAITTPCIYWNFSRRPGFFDEVCYTGTGSATTQAHNLTVAPEMIIVKPRNAVDNWVVYTPAVGINYFAYLNWSDAKYGPYSPGAWNNTTPTASVFSLSGSGWGVNNSGTNYVAYLFATCAGVSKVGSYTGNGTTQAIACGFTGGARFVLIKRTDSTGDWYVYDTARGMTTLTDPYLLTNSTAAEVATLGSVTTTTGGFTVDASILAAINTNAASYIFLAIA
jgi:hypothetical protein